MIAKAASAAGTIVGNPLLGAAAYAAALAGNIKVAAYLGTCENGVDIRGLPEYEPIMNDIGGTRKPFDRIYQGEDAMTIGTLTRWNEGVYRAIESIPNTGGFPGLNLNGDIGTMMITEGLAYTVWIVFPYATKPYAAANGMPAGYRFPFSYLEGPKERSVGNRANKIHIAFYHGRGYDPASGKFLLHDNYISGLPSPN